MNNEELHQFANDYRRLRSEMIEKSNQILSMFETAVRRSVTVQPSDEQINYLQFGLRITEGDYASNTDSQPPLQPALFSEGEKRPSARSLRASHAVNLNEGGEAGASLPKKIWEPLKRSLTSTQKTFDRNTFGSLQRDIVASGTREPERASTKQPEKVDTTSLFLVQPNQIIQVDESPNHRVPNGLSALKTQLSIVTEGNSQTSSCFSVEPPTSSNRLPELNFSAKLTQRASGQECGKALNDPSHTEQEDPSSSMDANASEDSAEYPLSVASSPKSEVQRQSSFHPSISRRRTRSVSCEVPSLPLPKRGSVETEKKETQVSLATPNIQSVRQSNKLDDPNMQPPNFLEYFLLFPAYDYKGRNVTIASLAAFGTINPVFHLNGIHPRSLFSNIWNLALGLIMFVLLWLIPFIAAYNPIYNICDVNFGDYSFDIREYEKARPTLPVWVGHWMKSKFLINLQAVSQLHFEFVLFISLIRCFKLWHNFYQCPTMIHAAWRLDEVAETSISRTLSLIGGIFWFIHCNSCTIFLMGRMSGFVGWSVMWPLVDSATLFETYIWTYYKAVGNMFPTSFNPWSAAEQIASLIYIVLAAVVYAIFLGAISSTVMAMNPSGRLFEQKVGELRDYIRSKDLSKETEVRLLTYYETRYRGKYFEEDSLLADLNDSLKAEILLQNTRGLIMNVPFLKRTAGDGRDELFMGRIAAALRSISYIAGDYVTKQGDSGSDMYLIFHGKAEVYVNERLAVTLGAGAYFGEVGLIAKTLRTATVKAVLPSLMYRLTYIDFHKILDDFTDMKRRMDMLADEREKVVKLEELNKIAIF
ncbi:hypothetical protein CcCBS67573_g08267 [Chytriomyces confervae]|uniref:Cyclic nucleotide-binding domain-containing protein n=1 Tax=Chytriomyces confervae TaxID=246404 RepID=A0A507EMA5_9FUNG|nr:hypothetical protein CcCBS67573_g08267 [Chytriomyces confervae]